ncbi:POK9 protein, partial [Galbula dea]|nr:POK9 protein [Galbula dea]
AGSTGVDVATAIEITLVTQAVQLIETEARGPLRHRLSALLLGRSSVSHQGIFVLPGSINADYCGVIKIMVYTLLPPVHVPKGSKIARLIPFKAAVPTAQQVVRGQGSFGSTGQPEVLLAIDIGKGKPEENVVLTNLKGEVCQLKVLIDTGADVTII